MQRLQDSKGLGNLERSVVGKHNPPGTDPYPLRYVRDMSDHDLRGRTCDVRQVVVLGQPIPLVAKPVGEAGQIERVAKRLGTIRRRAYRRDVQDGESEIHGV